MKSTSPRLGISIPGDEGSLLEIPRMARRLEELGYTDCWSWEVAGLDAFTPLAAAAAVTERMRFGTLVISAFTRPPGIIAMHVAAMAELAPQRFILGIGSSTRVVVEKWLGVPFARPLTKTVSTIQAVRALLNGEKVDGLRLTRPPEVGVPIYMAALGPKMLAAAGQVADGVCLEAGPRIIPQLLADVGRPMESVARLVAITAPSRAEELIEARRYIAGYALVPYYAALMERQGFGDEVRAIRERWMNGDRPGVEGQVSDAMVGELVLMGGPDRIAERIVEYRRAGLTCPVIAPTGPGANDLVTALASNP